MPGETVSVRITQDKKNFLRGEIVEVTGPASGRVRPPCPYVSHCGGCQYQHAEYAEELKLKEAQLREILPGAIIEPIVAAADPYGYRNSVTLHRTMAATPRAQRLGFIGRDNLTPAVVDRCLLADERLSAVFQTKFQLDKKTDHMSFKLSESGEIVTDREERFYRVRVGPESLLTSPRGFFQNNLAVAQRLAAKVKEWVDRAGPEVFFDLYAGPGTFSFLSARQVPEIYCVEDNRHSVEALKMNAAERGMNVHVVRGRAERDFPRLYAKRSFGPAVACVDPPRQGLAPELARFLGAPGGPETLIYISCDPATFTRDLKIIMAKGARRLVSAAPFDMFPRTKHIELAALIV
ncbi:MAG: hypothetical protein A3D28_00200 [Omnitrophica bacterium RIFCSPHIGHO2_02_FULL_63_14]|nr:MAG: hypothetical protein A3D28_00200 [Omnitrophica bacterium RIFCSPHIGHO2_02_FULL_63_14]